MRVFEKKYRAGLSEILKKKYIDSLRTSLKERYKASLKQPLKLNYQEKLRDPLRRKYLMYRQENFKTHYQERKVFLKERYTRELKQPLKDKYQQILKQPLQIKYQQTLKQPLQIKYQQTFKEPLKIKYQETLKEPLQIKYQEILKEPLHFKYLETLKTNSQLRYQSRKSENTFQKLLNEFHRVMCLGLTFECICCERILENGGTQLSEVAFSKLDPLVVTKSINPANLSLSKFLCHSCYQSLKKNEMTKLSAMNNFLVEINPEQLKLSDFEMQLIAKDLLFMKIFSLPKSRMPAIKDKVINVPLTHLDIRRTTTLLPRNFDESLLVNVQLKRIKDFKNVHSQALVRPDMLYQALEYLKTNGNCFYSDIVLNNFHDVETPSCDVETASCYDDKNPDTKDDPSEPSDINNDCLDTCLIPQNAAAQLISNKGMELCKKPSLKPLSLPREKINYQRTGCRIPISKRNLSLFSSRLVKIFLVMIEIGRSPLSSISANGL